MIDKIKELPFNNVKEIPVSLIDFEPALLELCKMNHCGNYGRCYTCPPLTGDIDSLIEKAKKFKNIIVFQKIYTLEDSFDIEGMGKGNRNFNNLAQKVNSLCKEALSNCIVLCAGGCKLCDRCGAMDSIPCRFPEKAIPSLESYGINVSSLAKKCDMNYINGQNTVTYFGGVIY